MSAENTHTHSQSHDSEGGIVVVIVMETAKILLLFEAEPAEPSELVEPEEPAHTPPEVDVDGRRWPGPGR